MASSRLSLSACIWLVIASKRAFEDARFCCIDPCNSVIVAFMVLTLSLACSTRVFNTAVCVSTVFWRFWTACCKRVELLQHLERFFAYTVGRPHLRAQ